MTNKRRLLDDMAAPDLERGAKTQGLSASMLEMLLRQGARPGDRLPTEHELAELFGVSRPTVRQALKSLDAAGLVESKPRRGTVLKDADMRSLAPWFGAHLMLALSTGQGDGDTPTDPFAALRIMAEARWTLERSVAAVAVRRRTDEDLAAMRKAEADYALAAEEGDRMAALRADAAYHHAYIAAAHNPVLSGMGELIDGYFDELTRLRDRGPYREPTPDRQTHTADEHRGIREALAARDAEAIVRLLDTHLGRTLIDDESASNA